MWTSLEIAKLAVGVLTPLVVVLVGYWINRHLKNLEHLRWASQKVIEKRIGVFEEMAPMLNDLMCYFTYIGRWKELNPPDVVSLKRTLDRVAHVNAPLFPAEFINEYHAFMNLLYSTFGGWGKDATLKTLPDRRKQAAGSTWLPEWENCFAERSAASEPVAVRAGYESMMAVFARSLGVGLEARYPRHVTVPANIESWTPPGRHAG